MKNTKTVVTSKKTKNKTSQASNRHFISIGHDFWKRKSSWLILPLGVMALLCLYFVVPSLLDMGYILLAPASAIGLIFMPSTAFMLIAVYGILYIYRILRGFNPRKIPQAIGWILVLITLLAVLYVVAGIGSTCTGLFGVADSCVDVHWFGIYVLLLNPFSVILWNILALVGSITLLIKPKS